MFPATKRVKNPPNYLELKPFQVYLNRKVNASGLTVYKFAENVGIGTRTLENYLTGMRSDGPNKGVILDTVTEREVDKIMCKLGEHIMDIYPELYPD